MPATNTTSIALERSLFILRFDDLCRRPERFAAYGRTDLQVDDAADAAAFARELIRRKFGEAILLDADQQAAA